MSAAHTPGPWGCSHTSNHAHDYRLTKPDGSPLPLNVEANDHSEQRANARLIAAAPDLLESADWLLHYIVFDSEGDLSRDEFDRMLANANAAIDKAEGRA